jgi:cytoskeletal protein CcmA (bactofilin family)
MGATYTRQSSSGIVDGGVIEASDLNNEFDQLLAAFVASTGHTHDGTSAEGGPITKLLGTSITIGDGTAGTDIAVTFDGESADGVLTWMEDEDYFKFSDEVLMNSTEKLLFGDTGTYIHQSADGVLDLVSDSEIEINATTIDINGAVDISGNTTVGGDLTVTGDDLTMGTNTDTAIMVADGTNFNPVVPSGDVSLTNAGVFSIASGVIVNADINSSAAIADSKLATISTAGKVDIGALEIDGATDIGEALADADLFIVDNGAGGTERKAAMSRVQTYIEGKISGDITISSGTAAIGSGVIVNADINSSAAIADSKLATISTADKVSGAAIQVDGATDGTSITVASSDKLIVDDAGTTKYITVSQLPSTATAADDIGTGDGAVNLTTSSGNITIDAAANDTDIIFKGTDNSSDITMLTLDGSEAGAATFNNKVIATELDISGDADIDGTLEADAITINGTAIGSIYGAVAGSSSIVTTGALDSGSITSGFGNIDTGSSTITTTGLITGGSLDIDDVLINGTTIGHTDDTDLMTVADGVLTVAGEVSMTTLDIGGTNVTSTAAELNMLDAVARGKIIYGNSSGATALLSPGSDGQVLTSDGTDISWGTSSGIGMGKAIAAALVFG